MFNFNLSTNSIIALICLLLSVGSFAFKFYKKSKKLSTELNQLQYDYKNLSTEFSKTKQKHKALAKQFNEKNQIIKAFENAEFSICQLLGVALLNVEETKVKRLAESIMFHFKNIK